MSRIVGHANSLDDLVRVFAQRRVELGIGQRALDGAAGIAEGLTGKLECGARNLGPVTVATLLGALGLSLVVVETGEPLPEPIAALVGTRETSARLPRVLTGEAPAQAA